MTKECPRCGAEVPGSSADEVLKCENCGLRLGPPEVSRTLDILREYFAELWKIVFQPSQYFRRMPGGTRNGRVARALGFALVTHWLGAVVAFFWRSLTSGFFQDRVAAFLRMFEEDIQTFHGVTGDPSAREHFFRWFWGTGAVIADPFLTLFSIFFGAFFVFIGARILTPSENDKVNAVTFESAVKIVAYGMSPAILAVIPFVGSILAPLGVLIVTVIGVREVYQISTGRSVVVALFPKILIVLAVLMGMVAMAAVIMRFVISFL